MEVSKFYVLTLGNGEKLRIIVLGLDVMIWQSNSGLVFDIVILDLHVIVGLKGPVSQVLYLVGTTLIGVSRSIICQGIGTGVHSDVDRFN